MNVNIPFIISPRIVTCTCSIIVCGSAFAQSNTTNAPEVNTGGSAFSLAASLRQPAVSQINGKASYSGGSMDSFEAQNFDGSISLPVGEQFGLQGDALYSRISDVDFFGGAGHFFWRDPAVGLFGIAGGGLHRDGVDTFQAGVEGAYYLGQFTFSGFAGVGDIRYDTAAVFIDTHPTDFVGRLSVDWYATENLRAGVSAMSAFGNELYRTEVEYQTPLNGLALTAEGAVGSHDYDHWLLGLRYYFGSSKSLRARHREDDPPSMMPQILHSLGLYGAEFNQRGAEYFASNPGAGSWSGGYGLNMEIVRAPAGGGGDLPPLPPTDLTDELSSQP